MHHAQRFPALRYVVSGAVPAVIHPPSASSWPITHVSPAGHETNHPPFHVAVENGEVTSASRTMFRTSLNWYLAKPIHDCQAVQSPITPRLHPADSKNVRGEITQAPREEDEVEVSKELGCVWRNKQGRKHSESRRVGLGWL